MKKYAGVWIDLKKAIIVYLDGNTADHKVIHSEVETRERYEGEGKDFGRFGDQYLTHEKQKKNRLERDIEKYALTVTEEIGAVDRLVIFGPAQMKDYLRKAVKENKQLSPVLADVMTADSMSDGQAIAWVRDYFNKMAV